MLFPCQRLRDHSLSSNCSTSIQHRQTPEQFSSIEPLPLTIFQILSHCFHYDAWTLLGRFQGRRIIANQRKFTNLSENSEFLTKSSFSDRFEPARIGRFLSPLFFGTGPILPVGNATRLQTIRLALTIQTVWLEPKLGSNRFSRII